MSTYADLVARAVSNIRALLVANGKDASVDEGRVEQALIEVLGEVVDVFDVDGLIVFDTPLFVTTTGVRTYPLPQDFGRTLTFREPRQTGIRCNDGTTEYDLFKEQTQDFIQGKATSNGRPARFILTSGGITLDPAPDSNSGSGYTIRGSYLQKLDYNTFDFQQEVVLAFPQALQDATQLRYLGQDYSAQLVRLINGEQRQKTELQWSYSPTRYRRWRRRGRG